MDSTTVYPVDCVFTSRELDDIDWYKANFESTVAEQEGLWIRDGGPTDEEWENYIQGINVVWISCWRYIRRLMTDIQGLSKRFCLGGCICPKVMK